MIERFIQSVHTDNPGREDPTATRDRLKARFAPGAVRRMTQLGMIVGALVNECAPCREDAVVYMSGYGESRALEGYLESFPTPSPTLFQTSIHPSGVQQGLIGRQQSVWEVFPLSGGEGMVAQALLTALLSPAERVILCGGEERGSWLRELGVASEGSFGFALSLVRHRTADTVGRIGLVQGEGSGGMGLVEWFEFLETRHPVERWIAPGWRLQQTWGNP